MSFGNITENDILKLYFQAVAIANIADNAAVSPLTSIRISLHTADPGEAGDQTTNECNYTGYARQSALRSASGFTVTNNKVENAGTITFGISTGGSNLVTHFAFGTAASGAGKIIARGAIVPFLVTSGVQPSFAAGSLIGTLN